MPGNWNHTPTQDHTALTQVQGTVSAGERSDPALNPPTQLSVLPFTDPERSEGDWDGEGGALSATQGVWFPSTGERSEPGISFLPSTLRTQTIRYLSVCEGSWNPTGGPGTVLTQGLAPSGVVLIRSGFFLSCSAAGSRAEKITQAPCSTKSIFAGAF